MNNAGITSFIKRHLHVILICFLLLLNIAQTSYFFTVTKRLNERITLVNASVNENRDLMASVSQYFEEKGNLTIGGLLETYDALVATVDRLESTIAVYDENVAKANENDKYLFDKVDKIQKQVDIILQYLSR